MCCQFCHSYMHGNITLGISDWYKHIKPVLALCDIKSTKLIFQLKVFDCMGGVCETSFMWCKTTSFLFPLLSMFVTIYPTLIQKTVYSHANINCSCQLKAPLYGQSDHGLQIVVCFSSLHQFKITTSLSTSLHLTKKSSLLPHCKPFYWLLTR